MYNGGPEGHEHVLLTAVGVYRSVTAALKTMLWKVRVATHYFSKQSS